MRRVPSSCLYRIYKDHGVISFRIRPIRNNMVGSIPVLAMSSVRALTPCPPSNKVPKAPRRGIFPQRCIATSIGRESPTIAALLSRQRMNDRNTGSDSLEVVELSHGHLTVSSSTLETDRGDGNSRLWSSVFSRWYVKRTTNRAVGAVNR